MSRKLTQEEFEEKVRTNQPDLGILGQYKSCSEPIKVYCRKCGHEWSPLARQVMYTKEGCPVCGKEKSAIARTKTPEWFDERLREINPDVRRIGEYRNTKTRVEVTCLRCGHEWTPLPHNLLNGYGCPRCKRSGTSYMEQFCLRFLVSILGDNCIKHRDRALIGKELDLYVPEHNFAIELGSWYWHRDKLSVDREKEQLCQSKGVTLLTIYDCYDRADSRQLPSNAIVFENSLAEEESHESLKNICFKIVSRLGIAVPTSYNWHLVEEYADEHSRTMSMDEFIEVVNPAGRKIEFTSKFKGVKKRIGCRCLACGHEWSTPAAVLLKGSGCPKCRRRAAAAIATAAGKTRPEDFESRLKAVNPTIKLLEEYSGSTSKIKVQCTTCGLVRYVKASSLLEGVGCPECFRARLRKSTEQFKGELHKVNQDIIVVGEYAKNTTPITVKCKICGYEWKARPSKLLNGTKCPKCNETGKHPVQCVETGCMYPSYADAARSVGLSSGDTISAVCKGRRSTAAGYHWRLMM